MRSSGLVETVGVQLGPLFGGRQFVEPLFLVFPGVRAVDGGLFAVFLPISSRNCSVVEMPATATKAAVSLRK